MGHWGKKGSRNQENLARRWKVRSVILCHASVCPLVPWTGYRRWTQDRCSFSQRHSKSGALEKWPHLVVQEPHGLNCPLGTLATHPAVKGQRQREGKGGEQGREGKAAETVGRTEAEARERKSGGERWCNWTRRTVKEYEFWVRKTNILSQ